MRVIILDTSAFIQGFTSTSPDTRLYTTPQVLNELTDEFAKIRASNWAQTGKLLVTSPREESLQHILDKAKKMGETDALSSTDQSVLALAHQLSVEVEVVVLISDDYGVQNLADELGLQYMGMITPGIKRRFKWINYCPGCRKQFDKPQPDNICPICGTQLKRKPGKKTRRRGGG